MRLLFILIILVSTSSPVFAWNAVGHKVIAQLAYNQLSTTEKQKIDAILKTRLEGKNDQSPNERFLSAAVWPDEIRNQVKYKHTAAWHYINLPLKLTNGTIQSINSSHQVAEPNVVWAIHHLENRLQDKSLSRREQATYLSFLIHLVGDIHQPLNCATLISKKYHFELPAGDESGNNYLIQTPIANNLHSYWNKGLGLLYNPDKHYFDYFKVVQLVNIWAQETRNDLSIQKEITNDPKPSQWAQESHQIALENAYKISPGEKPTKKYIADGRKIVRRQIMLAGNRLAIILQKLAILN